MNLYAWVSQAVVGLAALVAGVLAYFSSGKANRSSFEIEQQKLHLERNRADAMAFERAKGFYEATLTGQSKRIEALENVIGSLERNMETLRLENQRLHLKIQQLEFPPIA